MERRKIKKKYLVGRTITIKESLPWLVKEIRTKKRRIREKKSAKARFKPEENKQEFKLAIYRLARIQPGFVTSSTKRKIQPIKSNRCRLSVTGLTVWIAIVVD